MRFSDCSDGTAEIDHNIAENMLRGSLVDVQGQALTGPVIKRPLRQNIA